MTADTKRRRPPSDQVPAWVAYSGVGIVGGTALIVLAYYQHQFGLQAKMPELLSWTFSIGLDWGSAVAGIFWFFGKGPLKAWGRAAAILLLLGSTALTCTAWGLISGWQWAPVGLIHPLVAFLMAKLLTVWQAGRAEAQAENELAPAVIADLRAQLAQLTADSQTALDQATRAAEAAIAQAAEQRDHYEAELTELRGELIDTREDLRAARARRRATESDTRPAAAAAPKTTAATTVSYEPWDKFIAEATAFVRDNPNLGRRFLYAPTTGDPAGAGLPISDDGAKKLQKHVQELLAAEPVVRPVPNASDTAAA